VAVASAGPYALCKSAPRSRQTTTPACHHSVFYRPDALPATKPTKYYIKCINPQNCTKYIHINHEDNVICRVHLTIKPTCSLTLFINGSQQKLKVPHTSFFVGKFFSQL